MAAIGDEFKPGEKVPHSGIYKVVHDSSHAQPHEVTCVYGKPFPPCSGCKHPRFVLVYAAQHIEASEHFKK
jgi:hypothetical protein